MVEKATRTFATFVPTAGTTHALAKLRALLDGPPAGAPRALLLTGPSGAGKSHLLAAVGRESNTPSWAPGTQELRTAIAQWRRHEVARGLRRLACLLLDDLDRLSEMERTQVVLGEMVREYVSDGGIAVLASGSAKPLHSLLGTLSDTVEVITLRPPSVDEIGEILAGMVPEDVGRALPHELEAVCQRLAHDPPRAAAALRQAVFVRERLGPPTASLM